MKDLIETAHVFMKSLEHFCTNRSIVVQKRTVSRKQKTKSKYQNEINVLQMCIHSDFKVQNFPADVILIILPFLSICLKHISCDLMDCDEFGRISIVSELVF